MIGFSNFCYVRAPFFAWYHQNKTHHQDSEKKDIWSIYWKTPFMGENHASWDDINLPYEGPSIGIRTNRAEASRTEDNVWYDHIRSYHGAASFWSTILTPCDRTSKRTNRETKSSPPEGARRGYRQKGVATPPPRSKRLQHRSSSSSTSLSFSFISL